MPGVRVVFFFFVHKALRVTITEIYIYILRYTHINIFFHLFFRLIGNSCTGARPALCQNEFTVRRVFIVDSLRNGREDEYGMDVALLSRGARVFFFK